MNKEKILEYCLELPRNTIIIDSNVDESLVKELIEQSYELTEK